MMMVFQRLTDESFWEWLRTTNNDMDQGLEYLLDPQQRGRNRVNFIMRRMYSWHNYNNRQAPLTAHNYIWACSPNGVFYTHDESNWYFHHTSFLAGGRVIAAGHWWVHDGQLLLINNHTGHYKSTPAHLVNCLSVLDKKIDLSNALVEYGSEFDAVLVRAPDFIRLKAGPQCAQHQVWQEESSAQQASVAEIKNRCRPRPAGHPVKGQVSKIKEMWEKGAKIS
jgi:hypothetical protein